MSRLPFTAAVLAAAALISTAPAQAHAILLESQPAPQAAVPPGPAAISLKFNSKVDHARSRIALRANGTETTLPIDPSSAADGMAAKATLSPGAYVVRWQVLAVDGHITRGDVPFTVQAPSAPVVGAVQTPSAPVGAVQAPEEAVRTVQVPEAPARSLQTP